MKKVASASRELLSETEIARLIAEGKVWTEERAVAQSVARTVAVVVPAGRDAPGKNGR